MPTPTTTHTDGRTSWSCGRCGTLVYLDARITHRCVLEPRDRDDALDAITEIAQRVANDEIDPEDAAMDIRQLAANVDAWMMMDHERETWGRLFDALADLVVASR